MKDNMNEHTSQPSIEVGKFTIKVTGHYKDGRLSVWIQHESGEGGQFLLSDFEKVIEDYYNKNF